MTKEEIIEECNQRLGFETDCEMYSLCQHEKDFYNAIIKALEQQPSEDCVDRDHVIATISQHHFDKDKDSFDLLIHNLCKEIKELPPVTPTHGTCKDCKNFCCPNGIMPTCKKCFRRVTGDFYCADFEKRGNENDR